MEDEIRLISTLIKAMGYCSDQENYKALGKITKHTFEQVDNSDDLRLKYLQSKLDNCGEKQPFDNESELEEKYNALIEESAKAGVAESQYLYACRLYESSLYTDASLLYKLSANQGYPPSQYCFGLDLFNGVGVKKNPEEGLHYIELAAGRLYEFALDFLIALYSEDDSKLGIMKYELYSKMLRWVEKDELL